MMSPGWRRGDGASAEIGPEWMLEAWSAQPPVPWAPPFPAFTPGLGGTALRDLQSNAVPSKASLMVL